MFYPFWYVMRRLLLAIVCVFAGNYFFVQAWVVLFSSMVSVLYIYWFKPF